MTLKPKQPAKPTPSSTLAAPQRPSAAQQLNQANTQATSRPKLADVSYRHLMKLVNSVKNAETAENVQRGRANFQAAYRNLSSAQKQQFTQRYEKETEQPSLVLIMNMMLTGKPQQNQLPLRARSANPFANNP